MLHSIELENYRGLSRYRLNRLSRVNLLVGKNNCGKTSVLEAVHLIASGGDPLVLARTAWQRGEVQFVDDDSDRYRRPDYPDISHFFHGHEFAPGAFFTIGTNNGTGTLTVSVVSLEEKDDWQQLMLFDKRTELNAALGIRFENGSRANADGTVAASRDGALLVDVRQRFQQPGDGDVQMLTPDSLQPRSMSDMWAKVIVEGREAEVIQAMQILEPQLANIFFLSGERTVRYGGRTGVLVGFEGSKRRVPLGSHGEGMRRLLALSLSLIRTEGGVLLVDEIDTGLHWSIMGEMWLLVVKAAQQSNVQVFATTHSGDCVRGLAWLCENHPELQEEVSVQKLDRHLDEAVAMEAGEVMLAVEQGIEVR